MGTADTGVGTAKVRSSSFLSRSPVSCHQSLPLVPASTRAGNGHRSHRVSFGVLSLGMRRHSQAAAARQLCAPSAPSSAEASHDRNSQTQTRTRNAHRDVGLPVRTQVRSRECDERGTASQSWKLDPSRCSAACTSSARHNPPSHPEHPPNHLPTPRRDLF